MKAAAIGDNCIDEYTRLGRKYPTGNVVDTGVNLQKLGIPTSIISTTGSDENGRWMIETLKAEGLDLSHLKVGDGPTAITYMDMDGLDRVHGDYVEGVLENIVFDEEDVAFAARHDLVHSALWGKAENVLPAIKARGPLVSFDYADRLDHELVERTLPFVDYGFFSYHKQRDAFIEHYLRDKVARGMKVAVATFGDKGSLAFDGERFYDGAVFPAKVVNTVGAGDSFIAGFLYGVLNKMPVEQCLEKGARVAAEVVGVFEPWVMEKKEETK
ncbi:MAG: fructoselysine 6-kinase [Clostridiales bacterium]|nr:fructoselysine 6-kinase [Clostridiales bacterium]